MAEFCHSKFAKLKWRTYNDFSIDRPVLASTLLEQGRGFRTLTDDQLISYILYHMLLRYCRYSFSSNECSPHLLSPILLKILCAQSLPRLRAPSIASRLQRLSLGRVRVVGSWLGRAYDRLSNHRRSRTPQVPF